jgi:protein gp37
MGKTTIEWTDFTFNCWWGCAPVGPGCDHCYAEVLAARFGVAWGPGAARRFFGDKHWAEPLAWDRAAKKAGKRARVFCLSMGDVFDNEVEQAVRERLWALIRATPNLDWLLLTKRIGNAPKMLPGNWREGYPNAWLGISIVNQDEADRDIPKLLNTPAAVRFVSYEPALGPVHFDRAWFDNQGESEFDVLPTINWLIVGGESGPKARPFDLALARSVVKQCKAAGVAVFVKQLGAHIITDGMSGPGRHWPRSTGLFDTGKGNFRKHLCDRKGGDPAEWPEDIRIRQFPC